MALRTHATSRSLDWYIFRQVALATGFILFTLTCALWLIRSIEFIDLVVNRGMAAGTLFYLTWLLLPGFLLVLLPSALCTSILFVYNRLITESELVIMRAAGLSAIQLARPALIAATLVTALCYVLSLYVQPTTQRSFADIQSSFMRDFASVLLREGVFNVVTRGVVVYVRSRDHNGEMQGLIFHDSRERNQPVTIMAERGALVESESGPRVVMSNGNRQQVDRQSGKLSLLYFDRFSVDLQRTQAAQSNSTRPPWQRSTGELLADPTPSVAALSELHYRFVTPLYNLAFSLIGLAALLYGNLNRRGQNVRLAVAAFVVTVVWISSTIGLQTFLKWDRLLQFSAYVPPLAAAALSLWLLLRNPSLQRIAGWLRLATQG